MEQTIDLVFGPLAFRAVENGQGWWTKQEHLDLMGGPVPLEVYADANGPTEAHRQVYHTFKQVEKSLRAELQEALFAFYQIEREQYADACGDMEGYIENFLPVLGSSDEIWEILTPLSWTIFGPEDYNGQFGEADAGCSMMLSWHGCWDIEHAFSALFEEGRFLGFEALGTFFGPADLQPSPE